MVIAQDKFPQTVHELKESMDDFVRQSIFDFEPAQYVDRTQLPEWLDGEVVDVLQASPRGMHRFSRWLLQHFQLGESDVPFLYRLALLDRSTLETLCFYVGLVLTSPRIKTIILKKDLDPIKAAIGEPGYLFAIKRAPLYITFLPDVETPKIVDWTRENVVAVGLPWLCKALSGAPQPLLQRFALKWPKNTTLPLSTTPDSHRDNSLRLFYRLLVKELSA
ncbi:MAG: hypothetical protein A2Y14_01850 [Verrucomicrobia bacterium GWF2_51_19]|nr:MAG: hypothetical protein A2Y14_01850 [Verrucomicrobia bacterium GWF2_51_19]